MRNTLRGVAAIVAGALVIVVAGWVAPDPVPVEPVRSVAECVRDAYAAGWNGTPSEIVTECAEGLGS